MSGTGKPVFGQPKPKLGGFTVKKAESALLGTGGSAVSTPSAAADARSAVNLTLGPRLVKKTASAAAPAFEGVKPAVKPVVKPVVKPEVKPAQVLVSPPTESGSNSAASAPPAPTQSSMYLPPPPLPVKAALPAGGLLPPPPLPAGGFPAKAALPAGGLLPPPPIPAGGFPPVKATLPPPPIPAEGFPESKEAVELVVEEASAPAPAPAPAPAQLKLPVKASSTIISKAVTTATGAATAVPLPVGPILERKAFMQGEFATVKAIVNENPIGIAPADKVYRPITAPSFRRFMVQTFLPYSPTLTRIMKEKSDAFTREPKVFNKNACKERPTKLETFYYQKLVRDYMSRMSPYRGLLVYHGLGTGKTCTSIAAAEALYWGGLKKVYIMTPATLSPNYKKELGKCGFFPLNIQNNWAFLAMADRTNTKTIEFLWLRDVLGLPAETITRQGGGWVPNPEKASNWDTLPPETKTAILRQQDEHLNHRFEFIHYNGITTDKLSRRAMQSFREGKPMFDDSVVIVDEIHNMVRTVNGTKLGSRPMYNVVETVEPREFTWTQRLGRERIGFRYPRGYTLYRLLQNAVGCKFIALSATPMINYGQELAVLMNMIGGEIRVAELSLKSMDRSPASSTKLMNWAKAHPEIDFCAIEEREVVTEKTSGRDIMLVVTPVPYGFKKVVGADYNNRGFVRVEGKEAVPVQESRERNMDRWAVRLLKEMEDQGLLAGGGSAASAAVVEGARSVLNASTAATDTMATAAATTVEGGGNSASAAAEAIVKKERQKFDVQKGTIAMLSRTDQFTLRTLPLLPENPSIFVDNFVDRSTLEITHNNILTARISGLVSYYKGGSEELMPRVGKKVDVLVPMSTAVFAHYVALRQGEIEMGPTGKKEFAEGAATAVGRHLTRKEMDLYSQATKDPNTGFMSGTRAACNFVFPPGVKRPNLSEKQQKQILGIDKPTPIAVDRGDYLEGEGGGGGGNSASSAFAAAGAGEEGGEGGEEGEEEGALPEDYVEPALAEDLAKIVGSLMEGLEANADEYLNIGLPDYSPKYVAIMANLRESRGPNLVYSNFKSLEGLGIFAAALRASPEKWLPLDIQKKGDGQWMIPESLLGASTKGRPRYIMYTGDQELEKRRLLLQLYNADLVNLPPLLRKQCQQLLDGAPDNRDGRVCRAFMITQSGAEGISLLNTRQVHIMEPYWNNTRIQQVEGRAIRLCSHMNLEWEERVVDVFTYISVFTESQKLTPAASLIIGQDEGMTTDELIMSIAKAKQQLADSLFAITQQAAIDCELHFHEHGAVTKCLKYGAAGGPTFAYHPDWKVDVETSKD